MQHATAFPPDAAGCINSMSWLLCVKQSAASSLQQAGLVHALACTAQASEYAEPQLDVEQKQHESCEGVRKRGCRACVRQRACMQLAGPAYSKSSLLNSSSETDLWVAKVKNLIKQLIDKHKVGLDALLAELPSKVTLEQRHYLYGNRLMVRGCCSAQELWLSCPMSSAGSKAGEDILASSPLLPPVSCGPAESSSMHSSHRSPLDKCAGQARLHLQARAPLQATCHPTAQRQGLRDSMRTCVMNWKASMTLALFLVTASKYTSLCLMYMKLQEPMTRTGDCSASDSVSLGELMM